MTDVVHYSDLVEIIHAYDVVPVPVFWGVTSSRDNDAHGLYVESPRSKKSGCTSILTPIFLNLSFGLRMK